MNTNKEYYSMQPVVKQTNSIIKNDETLEEKLRKWVLIGLVSLVGGGAVLMIVVSLIRKIF